MLLPSARTTNIAVQTLDRDVLIYDLTNHKAYNLNETLAAIFNSCDGATTFDELKQKHRLSDEVIYLALDELKRNNLLAPDANYTSPFAGMSRREVIRRIGLGSLAAIPVISILIAPQSADAASPAARIACTATFINTRGTCPSSSLRCSSGFCTACLPTGTPVSGGCRGGNAPLCCNGGACVTATNQCG